MILRLLEVPVGSLVGAVGLALILTGCVSPASDPAEQEQPISDPPSQPAPPSDAPAGSQPTAVPPSSQPAEPAAPWLGARLSPSQVPAVFAQQWARAGNRDSCALIAPVAVGEGEGAVPRAATFSGGWAVAYDRPGLRSAFGVAGTSVPASEPSAYEWPFTRRWGDGSSAGYGPEGGTGPNQLAYLRIAGQDCLYNVWSNIGREHLEDLLEQLRFVEPTRPG